MLTAMEREGKLETGEKMDSGSEAGLLAKNGTAASTSMRDPKRYSSGSLCQAGSVPR